MNQEEHNIILDDSTVASFRQYALDMRYPQSSAVGLPTIFHIWTARELELADMVRSHMYRRLGTDAEQKHIQVLKLTSTIARRPTQEQLHAQAKLITVLAKQRERLLQQSREDRDRFEAERDGWERTAEALLARCAKAEAEYNKDVRTLSPHHVYS